MSGVRLIVEQFDPERPKPGGIDTCIRGLLEFAPPDQDLAVVGVDAQSNAPLYSLELLGEASMVSMRVGGELVSVKTGKDYSAEIGQPISVTVPANACHLFDQATGARIAA